MIRRPLDVALFLYALAAAVPLFVGCGPSSDLPGPTGTVSGNASYKDKPIPTGSAIVFVHKQTGIIGTAVTDANGDFAVKMRDGDAVLVGEYAVNIRPPGEPDENIMTLTKDNVPPAWREVPPRYWTPTTSTETYAVKEGANEYRLVLTD
jgi:hypothetical protein